MTIFQSKQQKEDPLYDYNYDMYSVYFVNLLNKIFLNQMEDLRNLSWQVDGDN